MSERIHAFGENGELSDGAELALDYFLITKVNPAISDAVSQVSGGTTDHALLTNRDAVDQHPIGAITNLWTTLAGKAETSHTHNASDLTGGTVAAARLPNASSTARGIVELATNSEAAAGTDTARAVTPANMKPLLDAKAPASHTHNASDLSGVVKTVNGEAPDGAGNVVVAGGGGDYRNWIPGAWCLPGATLTPTTSNESTSANTLYVVPFEMAAAGTVTTIAISVATAAESGSARLGIARQNATGSGWSLVSEAGTVDITTAGLKTISSLTIACDAPGLYGVLVLTEAACSLTSQRSNIAHLGLQNPFSTAARVYMSSAQPYGPLPATFTPAVGGGYAGVFHRALIRLA